MKIRMSELKRLVKKTINEIYDEESGLDQPDVSLGDDELGPDLNAEPDDMGASVDGIEYDADEYEGGEGEGVEDEEAPTSLEDIPKSANALRMWFDNFVAPDLADHPEQIPVFHKFVLKFKQLATGENEPGGPQLKTRADAITKRLKGLAADEKPKADKKSAPKKEEKPDKKKDKEDKDDDDKEDKD